MPRGKWIDKKTASHFTLVHRPLNDPLIHDDAAPQVLLNPTAGSGPSRGRRLDDLASEFGSESGPGLRDNEGEAASYGIFFDDTEYDYMQHLREPGGGAEAGGDVVFVPATAGPTRDAERKQKKKQQQVPLEEQLRQLNLEPRAGGLVDPAMLPSKKLPTLSYQAQQDIPDTIAGFQPDMDPRLREALEALEDDAYVDDGDDIFRELTNNGEEVTEREFEETYDDDDGWESDRTVKPAKGSDVDDDDDDASEDAPGQMTCERAADDKGEEEEGDREAPPSQDWMEQFKMFKRDQRQLQPGRLRTAVAGAGAARAPSSLMTTSTTGGRRKKRKGALTNPSTYSMTSSSLVRTEQLTILDGRFDKIEEEYSQEEEDEEDEGADNMSAVSGVSGVSRLSRMSTASSVTGAVREDLEGILDEFLDESRPGRRGKRGGKKGKPSDRDGLAQLDEIRRGLGPARIPTRG